MATSLKTAVQDDTSGREVKVELGVHDGNSYVMLGNINTLHFYSPFSDHVNIPDPQVTGARDGVEINVSDVHQDSGNEAVQHNGDSDRHNVSRFSGSCCKDSVDLSCPAKLSQEDKEDWFTEEEDRVEIKKRVKKKQLKRRSNKQKKNKHNSITVLSQYHICTCSPSTYIMLHFNHTERDVAIVKGPNKVNIKHTSKIHLSKDQARVLSSAMVRVQECFLGNNQHGSSVKLDHGNSHHCKNERPVSTRRANKDGVKSTHLRDLLAKREASLVSLINLMIDLAKELDVQERKINTAKTAFASASVVGNIFLTVGFGLSFVTLGTSLIPAIVGGAAVVAGASGSVTTSIIKTSIIRAKWTKIKLELEEIHQLDIQIFGGKRIPMFTENTANSKSEKTPQIMKVAQITAYDIFAMVEGWMNLKKNKLSKAADKILTLAFTLKGYHRHQPSFCERKGLDFELRNTTTRLY